jgi:hypothetical protein
VSRDILPTTLTLNTERVLTAEVNAVPVLYIMSGSAAVSFQHRLYLIGVEEFE